MERTLYEAHPAMFRGHPFLFILCCALILVFGLGLLIFLIWWLQCLGTTLTITDTRTTLRRGILSKYTNEVLHKHVRNVQVYQSLFQRILGTGNVGISSAGQSKIEIQVSGIPNPEDVRAIITSQQSD